MNANFLSKIPKVELHLHLEGAIPLTTLWRLVEKYGGAQEIGNMADLEQRFRYQDFPHFIETWRWQCNFLRQYEDFTLIACDVAKDLADQNVRYAEAFYSPGDFARHGLKPQEITAAIRRGLDTQSQRITVNLVTDLIRDFGPELGSYCLHEIAEVKTLGVIGVGIGGSEQMFPPEAYADVYREARRLGFRTSAHAGEASGPASIWGAIRSLQVDRIGHGTRAMDDPKLVAYLQKSQLPIEMCPISNLRTGVVKAIEHHPLGRFYREGLLVSVNSDDPKMFNTSLEQEYRALMHAFGFTAQDIVHLLRNAIRSAWCDEERRAQLMRELDGFVW
jgi:adenosine deaminase